MAFVFGSTGLLWSRTTFSSVLAILLFVFAPPEFVSLLFELEEDAAVSLSFFDELLLNFRVAETVFDN